MYSSYIYIYKYVYIYIYTYIKRERERDVYIYIYRERERVWPDHGRVADGRMHLDLAPRPRDQLPQKQYNR